jgi:phenylalanyl-tRNA synthetase beta chain
MKISYNWLKSYVQTELSPNELAQILTDTGLEVDGIEKIENVKGGLEGVFVGEVLSCEKHPDADKLKVTQVSIGVGEPLKIVCGAPNVDTGQKVIVATVGSTLWPTPEESFKIKVSKIRGVESFGMLCAEDELGLGKSHDGIIVLPEDVKVGLKAASYFDLEEDYQIEIGLTPNRSDALGHIGVARDIVAYLNTHKNSNLRVQMPFVQKLSLDNKNISVRLKVNESQVCPKYFGVCLTDIKVEPSPVWLQKRLKAVGLNPINNIVDCTNYVMRELGTPLHAFDADKVGGLIEVKMAKDGDSFVTLDGVERKLSSSDLMITNGEKYLAIAGVLGGLESGVSQDTTNIFIESAYFNPVSIRKTAKRHALNTDASFRYERGVDPELTEFALLRVVSLIKEISKAQISSEIVAFEGEEFKNIEIEFDLKTCNSVIGMDIPVDSIHTILLNLDFSILAKNGTTWMLKAPLYRVDVTREIDVIEEILRIYGFNNVSIPEKLNASITLRTKPNTDKIQASISEFLVGKGFSEMLNNSLTSSEYYAKFSSESISDKNNVSILNPLSKELDVMRQSLLFNALEVVAHNQNRQNSDLKLFEFGKTYSKNVESYIENKRLLLLVSGKKESEQWNSTKETSNFYTIKGIVNALLARMGFDNFVQENTFKDSLLKDGIELSVLKQSIGQIGWIDPKMKKHFGIKQDVFIADLDWDMLIKHLQIVKVSYKELPKTFSVRRDFSLLLDKKTSFHQIKDISLQVDKKLLKEVNLFDVYEGEKLEEGKKSYAVSFFFQDSEKTLKDEQIDSVMSKIRSELESKLDAQLR